MKAAVLRSYGAPRWEDFDEPEPRQGHHRVAVRAATVNAVDVVIAAGKHYLSPPRLPVVVGIEGVGLLEDGKRVYFSRPAPPYGSMAERTLVPEYGIIELPDAVDDAVAAALGNAGLAALMPLASTAALRPGESVLVLGATGVVGKLAVQVAKLLGAGRVVAVGRDPSGLEATRQLGADITVRLGAVTDATAAFRQAVGGTVDVVIDYTWGPPAEAALRAGGPSSRLIQVGDRAGPADISSQVLRSTGASIRGFMPIHAGPAAIRESYQRLVEWAIDGKVHVEIEKLAMSEVERAWGLEATSRRKLVLVS